MRNIKYPTYILQNQKHTNRVHRLTLPLYIIICHMTKIHQSNELNSKHSPHPLTMVEHWEERSNAGNAEFLTTGYSRRQNWQKWQREHRRLTWQALSNHGHCRPLSVQYPPPSCRPTHRPTDPQTDRHTQPQASGYSDAIPNIHPIRWHEQADFKYGLEITNMYPK